MTAAEWGRGWETRGQGVTERGVLGTAQAALSGLVGALGRLSVRQDGALESVAEEAGGDEGDAQTRETTLATPQDTLLATVEDFVAASQELDLRVAAALTAIKELECIAHGLGLCVFLLPAREVTTTDTSPPLQVRPSPAHLAHRSPRLPLVTQAAEPDLLRHAVDPLPVSARSVPARRPV